MSDNPSTTNRMSYQPEYVFGSIPDANGRWTGEYGLKPWPAHIRPRHTDFQCNASSDPRAFLAITPSMRQRLAATCDALIALLDEIDGDENLEETADDEPLLGWPNGGQKPTPEMASDDDREQDDCDLEPDHDGERELGWQNEGSQQSLHGSFGDLEPNLGWSGHGIGWREGETTDDREHDAGDDREDENEHFDYGEFDGSSHLLGGGSISQHEDGWRPDPNYVPPIQKPSPRKRSVVSKHSRKARQNETAGTKGEILFKREAADSTPMPRYMWNDQWTGNLPPEANEVLIPTFSMHKESP